MRFLIIRSALWNSFQIDAGVAVLSPNVRVRPSVQSGGDCYALRKNGFAIRPPVREEAFGTMAIHFYPASEPQRADHSARSYILPTSAWGTEIGTHSLIRPSQLDVILERYHADIFPSSKLVPRDEHPQEQQMNSDHTSNTLCSFQDITLAHFE